MAATGVEDDRDNIVRYLIMFCFSVVNTEAEPGFTGEYFYDRSDEGGKDCETCEPWFIRNAFQAFYSGPKEGHEDWGRGGDLKKDSAVFFCIGALCLFRVL